ncbi:aminotransferase, class I/II [Hoylesella buccalis ATCC 35310]|uniref:cysteine-S-conjugate beta-lyase n=1 Tax=Hoylesella buccalis ATCC 35310 TaxID=679190 RepID=D1W791_9BACT|nr:MalY/PatB family protein [Hoylesella buccalis]EFA91487.1 aminotransferase, class I/II [Hoylesella buccalis ATCC 35310]
MKYDFDEIVNRRGTNSVKWDEAKEEGVIPMWVADMDFKAAPCILEALKKRVEHGVFGYTIVPDSYYESIISWFERRHQWHIERDWIIYTSGVVPAISAIIKALTEPGDKVLVQTPVYNCFFSSIRNNGCTIAENALVRKGNSYEIDFDDFERQAADEKTKVFLLCNPHNPAGRVWTQEELSRMNDICLRHNVKVIADEIHCELVMPGHVFTPFAAVSKACQDNCITTNSPTKSFNIAGLQIANIITSNAEDRQKIDRAININEVCDVNPFGVIALQAAYNEGEDWIDQLNVYLWENYQALKTFFKDNLPQLEVINLEGTYLVWVNVRATGMTGDELTEKLLKEGKVFVNRGTMYGKTTGADYIRINIAMPRSLMLEGLKRMKDVIDKNI